jgi:hypothetical protein
MVYPVLEITVLIGFLLNYSFFPRLATGTMRVPAFALRTEQAKVFPDTRPDADISFF